MRVGRVGGSGRKGGLGGLPTPCWCCVQGSCAGPCFRSWHLRSGTWFGAFFLFLATLCGFQDLSSPTKDWTRATAVKAQSPNHWTIGEFPVWAFLYLIVYNCPGCTLVQLFLVPYSFFVFCCSKRRLSRCKHCSKGSQDPACLNPTPRFPLKSNIDPLWLIHCFGMNFLPCHLWSETVMVRECLHPLQKIVASPFSGGWV